MRRLFPACCLCALAAAGCGRSEIVPVSGRVTQGGRPVLATVSFQPTKPADGKTGTGSFARTDRDGSYQLELVAVDVTYGAVVGEHKVVVLPADDQTTSEDAPKPGKGLSTTFVVPEGGTLAADFDIGRPARAAAK